LKIGINPTERVWEYIKEFLAWLVFSNLDELRVKLQEILSSLTNHVIGFLTGWSWILRLFRTYCANFLGKCQNSNARISKFLKFLNPKPHLFNSFNLVLIPSTIPLVVLSSKYPTISPNHLLIVSTLFL